ncbi:MAG: hypothetical protein R3362_00855 [Rhodothermales bacterium]|nr:hypothetical protein [Rhodothermales bacterium]
MDFFEFVWLVSLTVGLPLIFIKTVYDYKRQRLEAERDRVEGAGLTVGDLKRALRETVEEANRPLVERIEALEHPEPLPERRVELPEPSADPYADDAEKSMGRRVQS